MKKIFFIFLFFLPQNSNALEALCSFEEVYKNGSIQQGFFLLKDNKLRYQYLDQNLFTIIIKKNKYFLVPNNQKDSFSVLNENIELIEEFAKMLSDFPNIKDTYNRSGYTYLIEKSSNNFIKRVAIKSSDLNLSINFLNCEFKSIQDKYFIHFPILPYKP
tara:strand:+ start:134 stop:613 length:480 start_codon:yes stop_codon:yes gene_type:complete